MKDNHGLKGSQIARIIGSGEAMVSKILKKQYHEIPETDYNESGAFHENVKDPDEPEKQKVPDFGFNKE